MGLVASKVEVERFVEEELGGREGEDEENLSITKMVMAQEEIGESFKLYSYAKGDGEKSAQPGMAVLPSQM